MWHLSGLEYHVAINDRSSKNTTIERIAGAVNAAYDSLEQHTQINSRWMKQTQYPCMLASDYCSTVKSKSNLLINNLRSEIESFLINYTSITSFDIRFINILNSTKLSKVLTHYGLYDLILDIHKLLSRDKATPPHIIEAITATEQFNLMNPDMFKSHLSVSNAFYLITINNEFHYHSPWMTEQIFYRLYSSLILEPLTYRVKSSRNNCSRNLQKAMFRKLQFYHELDHYHNHYRLKRVVAGYFRKYQRLIHYQPIPPLAVCITWSYFNDWIGAIDDVQDVIDQIPKSLTEMQSFCESEEYRNLKNQYKSFQRYYGDLHCNHCGSYRLDDDYKCDLVAVLGYLMISNASYISEILQSENRQSLASKLSAFWRQKSMTKCYTLRDGKIKLRVKQLLQYDIDTIQSLGIQCIIDVYGSMDFGIRDIGEYGTTVHVVVGEERVHYIVAESLRFCVKNRIDFDINAMVDENEYFPIDLENSDSNHRWYQMSWSKRMEYVMMFYYACSCLANSMYLRVLSLLKLTKICHENGYYLLGIKCLNCAYNLCVINAELLPSFTSGGYHKWRRKFNKMSKKRRCQWCGGRSRNYKQMTCASCMRMEYCSKECQAAHWQSSESSESCHREECLSSWQAVNRMLEKRLFSRVKSDAKAKLVMRRRYKMERHERRLKIASGWMGRHFNDFRDPTKTIDLENAWSMVHLVMHYWDGSNEEYPIVTVIKGRKWLRSYSEMERKYFWTFDDGTNTISLWNPWKECGLSAPWMKSGSLQRNRLTDD